MAILPPENIVKLVHQKREEYSHEQNKKKTQDCQQ